jgi:hypothetical protein
MSDHDDEKIESLPASAPASFDRHSDALDLLVALTKPKEMRKKVLAHRRLERNIADAEQKFAAITAQAEQVQAALDERAAALDVREAAISEREAGIESSLADARDELAQREQKTARLEAAWRMLGEPADVMSGFRSPAYSPLQKARLAHGQPPGRDPDLLFSEPDTAPDQRIDAYIRRDVGDERSDAQGNAFAPSTLHRDISHKRRGAQ